MTLSTLAAVAAWLAAAVAAAALLAPGRTPMRIGLLVASALWLASLLLQGEASAPALGAPVLLILANLYGLLSMLAGRAAVIVPRPLRPIREAMGDLNPGLFRRLMKAGETVAPAEARTMTVEGERPDALWFIHHGEARVSKQGRSARLPAPCFVGELSWLRGGAASAHVELLPGAAAVRWPHDRLRRAIGASPRLETALNALIARDMADKVAAGHPGLTDEAPGDPDAASARTPAVAGG